MTPDYSHKVWDVNLVFLALTLQYRIPFHFFLVCISEIFSSSHGALCFQPAPLSLGLFCRLVLLSPMLSCHSPPLPQQTVSFFSTNMILTGLGELLLELEHSPKSTPARAVG